MRPFQQFAKKKSDTLLITARFPPKCAFLFIPKRYKVAYGGRGSAKSWNFARALIIRAFSQRIRVLCARELQNSIKESVHHLLESQIELLGFAKYFHVTDNTIRSHIGSEFIFTGLYNNQTKIKSMEALDVVWVEEAEKVTDRSWEFLIPTMRDTKNGESEIWITFNPDQEDDPTFVRFVKNAVTFGNDIICTKLSWRDNPWFPKSLKKEKDYLQRVDPDAYAHVWEGECRTNSDAQVMRGKYVVEGFDPQPDWDGPYQGADWGFARDPTTLVRCWIHERKLYIEHEAYGIGVDSHKLAAMFDRAMPNAKLFRTRADNARPETVSYMQQHGYPEIVCVEKWPGSVEDGITFLRQFESIVIHPRCTHVADEFRLYSYKIDKLSGDVLPEVVDNHNHTIDAIRYALQTMIKNASQGMLVFLEDKKKEQDAERQKIQDSAAQIGTAAAVITKTQQGQDFPPIFALLTGAKK